MARLNSMLIGVEILLYGIAWETVFISFVYYASLSHIRIGKRVFPAVTVQKVAAAPHAQAAAQGDDQGLQTIDGIGKRFIRLHDGRSAFHVPLNVKGVFLVGSGKVLVAGMLRYIKLVAKNGRTPPRSYKIYLPPSIIALSSWIISSLQ